MTKLEMPQQLDAKLLESFSNQIEGTEDMMSSSARSNTSKHYELSYLNEHNRFEAIKYDFYAQNVTHVDQSKIT